MFELWLFKKGNVLKYSKKNRLTFFDFLAQIGGSVGLAMGLSIISFVEIIYWFTFHSTEWITGV